MNKLTSETNSLTPELIGQVQAAWVSYVQSKVSKGLSESDRPVPGSEREAWPGLVQRFQDKAWRLQGLQKDEKFEMHFNAAVRNPPLDPLRITNDRYLIESDV